MVEASVSSPAVAIDALFLAVFDDHKGQSLIWKRSLDKTDELDGIEFQALPSGLHLVPTDTFYYHYVPAKTDRPGRLGISVFQNKELDKEEIELAGQETGGRGRLMLSLGVVMHDEGSSPTTFPPLTGLRDLVSKISTAWAFDLKGEEGAEKRRAWLDGILEPFWVEHQSSESIKDISAQTTGLEGLLDGSVPLSADHPIHYFEHLLARFGIDMCTLWKYSSTNRRILFYTNTPLEPVCQAAWCTWILSQKLKDDDNDSRSMTSSSTFLGTVGLMDMSKIQGIKGGYIACTSDAIFKDRPQLWDLLVDLGSGTASLTTNGNESVPISMRARIVPETAESPPKSPSTPMTKPITHTFSDESLWKEVQVVSSRLDEDFMPLGHVSNNAGLWGYAYGAYSTLCDFCWGFCAVAVGLGGSRVGAGHGHNGGTGTGYIRLPQDGENGVEESDEEGEDDDGSEDGELVDRPSAQDGLSSTRRILGIFERRTERLTKGMQKFGNKTSLSKDDMSKLGLSTWSWVDVDFVRALHVQTKRDQAFLQVQDQDAGGNASIQVERGWFRWVSSIVGA